jgi:hypothetical protein
MSENTTQIKAAVVREEADLSLRPPRTSGGR